MRLPSKEPDVRAGLKIIGKHLEVLGKIKEDLELRKQWDVRQESTRAARKAISPGNARPTPQLAWEMDSRRRHNSMGPKKGAVEEGTQTIGNGLYIQGREAGSTVRFLVETGSGVLIFRARVWNDWAGPKKELRKYWGWLCSTEGGAFECLGRVRLTITWDTQAIDWDFIVAELGEDRDIHSNQGTNFGSWIVAEVCRLFGIHKTHTTPYHPRSDGFIERSFRTLGCCLKATCRETRQGRIGANHTNELPGDAPGESKSDAEHNDVVMTDSVAYSGHLRSALGTSSGREDGEPV